MRIAPLGLNVTGSSSFSFEGRQRVRTFTPDEIVQEQDTFLKREDNYTKKYRELIKDAGMAMIKAETNEPSLSTDDINFLLEIKDYEKFRALITAPVTVPRGRGNMETNIFFYTDAAATKKLVKKLNDRAALKKILTQRIWDDNRTVFFNIAQNDDVKKAKALQEGLSAKEFKKFMSAKNDLYESPYSVAKEQKGALKAYLDPIFADET